MMEINAALEHSYPDRTVMDISIANGWIAHHTARVEFEDGQSVYIKTAANGDSILISRQVGVSEYVSANTRINTPDVLRVSLDPPEDVKPYFITEPISGTEFESEWTGAGLERRREFMNRVGRMLAVLHECRFGSPGSIIGGSATDLDLNTGTWPNILDRRVAEFQSDIPQRFSNIVPRIREVLSTQHDMLTEAPSVLLHGDPQPNNCFIEPTGLIDWETAVVGDPVLDIAQCERSYIDPPEIENKAALREELHKGYEAHAGSVPDDIDERLPLYHAVVFLGTIRSFEQWAPHAPEPVEELADWTRTEFQDRVNEIESSE
jgi:thiamine kinase-like enzyme